ncbi:ABC transporter ATP-binding protein [[Clostridium] innocuum]|nr:ABC transporter ATP-binding protein [[Clostridium] innocuum]MCR0578163.1 ABC transporter ATP-binding protein [[Clostridium] innocuum]
MQIIEIERLSRDYGEGRGIFDISFSIAEGEVFGFLGPNGAGKTTTIRHLLGFLKAKQGSARILGMDCWKQADAITRQLGYIPGEINLLNEMSGEEFLRFMARYRNMQDSGRTQELLERFELRPTGAIRRMSKGMKQKLGIVAAFMHDPKVLILDEPTSGLDPLMQNAFVELIQEEKQRGKTILMSSHMFEEVEKTCDRIGIIRQGHMAAVEDTTILQKNKTKTYILTFADSSQTQRFLLERLNMKQISELCVHVYIREELKALLQLLPAYELRDLSVATQSLEDIFLQYYGERGEAHE